MKPIDILAFSPHPDDAEIGCAGLLLLAAREGMTTAIVDLSEGEMSTSGTGQIRQDEKTLAAERLGLACREGLNFPDTQIGQTPNQEGELIACIRRLRPRLVLAPYFDDRHPDHVSAAHLIKRAAFLSKLQKVGQGVPHRVERQLNYCIHQPFEPSFVLDISGVWSEYQNCLDAYQSQFFGSGAGDIASTTDLNDGSFLRSIESRCRHYGAMINVEFGEPYFSSSPLSLNSASSLLNSFPAKPRYGSFQ